MKKNRLLNFLLVGGLLITSAAISFSSCKKNNEADEDLNLPLVETVLDNRDWSFMCPYCTKEIPANGYHMHHFSPREGENTLPSNWEELHLTWGSLDSLDQYGNIVYEDDGVTPMHQRTGNRAKPFTVEFCESISSYHFCPWCAQKIYHRHKITFTPSTNPQITNGYHVGGGTLEP